VRRSLLASFLPCAYPIIGRPTQSHDPIFPDNAHKPFCYEIAFFHVLSLCAHRFALCLESIESALKSFGAIAELLQFTTCADDLLDYDCPLENLLVGHFHRQWLEIRACALRASQRIDGKDDIVEVRFRVHGDIAR
jgi:hypothetical protein